MMFRRKNRHALKQILAALAILCLLPLVSSACADENPEDGAFTLLVYMTGSNLESEGEAASADLQEMMAFLPEGENIRILVQAGGSESWGLDVNPDKATRLEIRAGSYETVSEADLCSMGDGQTLADFLQWGYAWAPANRYGLILWDHGAGPLLGVCFDEQFKTGGGDMDSLSADELASALEASPFRNEPLCFIGFDACLMGTVEIACLVSPYAEYMIASQETEPAVGWNYAFLREADPAENGAGWGRKIVAAYADSLQESTAPATLACLDLSRAGAVTDAIDDLFGSIADELNEETYARYARARAGVRTLGSRTTYNYDLIDLTELLDAYERDGLADGSALKAALEEFIVDFWSRNDNLTHGVSIYYPFDNKARYISPWSAEYDSSSFSGVYRSFIREISGYFLRDSLFDRDSEFRVSAEGSPGRQLLQIPLTEKEAAGLVRARMIVLEELVPDYYRIVYYDDQKIRQTDTFVASVYSGEALFVTDRDGGILAGPVSYLPVEDGVALYCLLTYRDSRAIPARLIYQQDENGQLVLSQIVNLQGGEAGIYLPAALELSDFSSIEILSFGPQNDDVTSLGYIAYYPWYTVELRTSDDSWMLSFLKVQTRFRRFAYMRMTDVNGDTVCSDAVEIPNTNYYSVSGSQEMQGTEKLELALSGAELVVGYDPGLLLVFSLHNKTAEEISVDLTGLKLGGLSAGSFEAFELSLAPDADSRFTVFIPLDSLQKMDLPEMITEGTAVFTIDGEPYEALIPLSMNSSALTAQDDFTTMKKNIFPAFGNQPDSP